MSVPDNFIEYQYMYEGVQFNNDDALFMVGGSDDELVAESSYRFYLYQF
ncbi:hypothetical protein QWI17_02625 [Gilvimarinus sp. SDUM040013]|uniref:Uncharacterized protein n=1 Tax=Gilvimarinus gilvus TaxID=3058038 RepID=A0ABU4S0W1_9GAMM|nr:hypothetical protein [Gilvimarinus sp. SDUM040013]MDO3384728.1 hypothetical protein [Gilvimarinus sp. SDUM040013]MDX6850797.1 hypothetical protein [Gilvimarinus sp. SDUM040013]